MESSTGSSPFPPSGLSKTYLQEICKGLDGHIKEYDYLISRQLASKNKNYKKIVKLCERKLGLLKSYKKYRTKF